MDRVVKKKSHKTWILGGLSLIAIGIACVFIFKPEGGSRFAIDRDRVNIAVVKHAMFEDYLPLRVTVEPYQSVYLDAVEGGRVEDIFVEEGDLVQKGQKLIELSNSSLQLDIISREAQVNEQLNDLRNTKLAIERNRLDLKSALLEIDYQIKRLERRLKRREHVVEYIDAEAIDALKDELDYFKKRRAITLESQEQEEQMRLVQIEQLEANVTRQEKNLVIARSNLDNLIVKAPRSGRLTSFNTELGESKVRGERLGQVDDIDRYKVSARVSEFYLNKLTIGQIAELEVSGKTYLLELRKIFPEVINNEFEIELVFSEKTPPDIRRGQSLTSRLILSDREEVLLVDNGSFMLVTGGAWVFALAEGESIAYKREVKFGRKNPNHLEIEAGLDMGDRIIVSSYANYEHIDQILIRE